MSEREKIKALCPFSWFLSELRHNGICDLMQTRLTPVYYYMLHLNFKINKSF